ncbi:uncharacterized protein LOC117220769 [Megalopta genalis]|uniref:uncharacterized protein LOC117220769 n=1 Tax=Megalopta genalis TaxID=115081 RepID=UPI0014430839|nr:uncharacterized protein LOC117220769 [Megalopta genalis]
MRLLLFKLCPLLFFLTGIVASGIGKAWQVLPYATYDWAHPSWPRSASSPFEIRSVSGVGRLDHSENAQTDLKRDSPATSFLGSKPRERFERVLLTADDEQRNRDENRDVPDDPEIHEKIFHTGLMMTVFRPDDGLGGVTANTGNDVLRVRRDADNETKMEQIATTKNVREGRMSSPETWSSQSLSVEYPHRGSLDQMIQQTEEDQESPDGRGYQNRRADFVTSHHRRSYDHRDMPMHRAYDDYDYYRNLPRDREYDPVVYRRRYSYYYPDRYRMERNYYMHVPQENSYYYDRYRDEDLDLYRGPRPTPKPKRIIYYATLPEVVRKPVDLRNYPRPYEGTRTPVSRDRSYKRIPGNVDPSGYRFRRLYDAYDSYLKRSSFDRPYSYPDEEARRKMSLESLRNNEPIDQNSDRKLASQVSIRNDGKLPWPVQIGTEVSVKDDDRVPGRKIYGDSNGYERFQNAQLQKAPDATGSSELQSDN